MGENYAYGCLATAGLVLLGACQTTSPSRPAILETADARTLDALKSALAEAMGVASIALGAGDLSATSTIAVLPPPAGPLEGRSTARPTLFELKIRGEACVAVRAASGEEVALPGVRCRLMGG